MRGSPDFGAGLRESLPRDRAQGVLVVAALVIAAGAFTGCSMLGKKKDNASDVAVSVPTHKQPAPVIPPPPVPAPAGNSVSEGNLAAKPGAANANANASPTAGRPGSNRAASTDASGSPVVVPVARGNASPAPGSNLAHLDEHLTYQYNALGRRDPYQSLVTGDFVGADVGGDAPPDVGGLKVVGIVWGTTDQFALVEDARGNSYVLRQGDKVQNGVVEGLKRDGLIVNITADGQSQTVVVPLTRKGDSNAR